IIDQQHVERLDRHGGSSSGERRDDNDRMVAKELPPGVAGKQRMVLDPQDAHRTLRRVSGAIRTRDRLYDIGSTSTSHPFDVGIPVPSVSPANSRHVGGPYGTNNNPRGMFPSLHRNTASPVSVRTRTLAPVTSPSSFMSSGCIVSVPTIA